MLWYSPDFDKSVNTAEKHASLPSLSQDNSQGFASSATLIYPKSLIDTPNVLCTTLMEKVSSSELTGFHAVNTTSYRPDWKNRQNRMDMICTIVCWLGYITDVLIFIPIQYSDRIKFDFVVLNSLNLCPVFIIIYIHWVDHLNFVIYIYKDNKVFLSRRPTMYGTLSRP